MPLGGSYFHCLRRVSSYYIVGKCFYFDLSFRFDTVVNIFNEETREQYVEVNVGLHLQFFKKIFYVTSNSCI